MTFNDTLKSILPIITTGLTVANPLLGGIAGVASSIASVFGLGKDAKPEEIIEFLKNNTLKPEQWLELQKLESTLKQKQIDAEQELRRTQSDLTKLDMQAQSFFRNAWHASCCWLCIACLFYHYLFRNLLFKIGFPPIDNMSLDALWFGFFGFAGISYTNKIFKGRKK